MKASGSKNKDPPKNNPLKKALRQDIAECPLLFCGFFPDVFCFFAILVADEGFRIQKLEKTGVKTPKENKGCEEHPGLRAPGSNSLNNNNNQHHHHLKDKKSPAQRRQNQVFLFFASLVVADEGLWMQKLEKTGVRHAKTKQRP